MVEQMVGTLTAVAEAPLGSHGCYCEGTSQAAADLDPGEEGSSGEKSLRTPARK